MPGEETMPVLEVVADLEEEGGDGVGICKKMTEPELPWRRRRRGRRDGDGAEKDDDEQSSR